MHDPALPELLARRWGDVLEPGERFLAERSVEGRHARACFTHVARGGAEHHVFEVDTESDRLGGDELLALVTDACDLALGAWLEEGRPRLPGVPEEREFEGVPVRFLAALRRPGLEAEADRLLGEDPPGKDANPGGGR